MIILYGRLRQQFGEKLSCKVHSTQELMKAAEANRPGFVDYIRQGKKYLIRRGEDFRTAQDVGEEELTMRFAETTWHVLPMPSGYSGGLRIVMGLALVGIGLALPGAWAAAVPYFVGFGASLAIGGVASLLAPMPKVDSYDNNDANENPSYLFDGPTNRVAAGGAVPLVYGFDVFVGSTFISGGLDVGDIV